MQLREYQQRSIDQLYEWMRENDGNPCLELPTGAGKSHIVAALCKDALQNWPETRVLMLTHMKELIEQNAAKMREHWPNAPLGIYSASVGKKQLGEPITFAGIQSISKRAAQIGHTDIIIIDECHLVGHKDEGGYRALIAGLQAINPSIRVIGLTATPYRLGHGLITDKPAIFDGIVKPVSIEELVFKGYLAPLRSKHTGKRLDTTGVHKRGGEFIESELQAAVNTDENNDALVSEIMARAEGRRSWLLFCAGVQHAQAMADALIAAGVKAECVTGATPKKERERIIASFKAGEITALTNANVLTTGFDAPDTDLIVLARPTLSPALYVQMAGRGMRLKSHIDDCLVLDFAGCVETHGPVTAVIPPSKNGEKSGKPPVKPCPECGEILHASTMTCTACGHIFEREEPKLALRNDDIMGIDGREMAVTSWLWSKHTSQNSGKDMLRCTYYGLLSDKPVTEYFCVTHTGYAGDKAARAVGAIAYRAGVGDIVDIDLLDAATALTAGTPPASIEYKKDGNFYRVLDRIWQDDKAEKT